LVLDHNKISSIALFEKRWPVALTIIIVTFLLWMIPDRVSIVPNWTLYVICVFMLIPIAAIGISKANPLWIKSEKYVLLFFLIIIGIGNLLNLSNLVQDMLYKSGEISGLQLLTSSISVWINNILMFSLLYWQIDRGGPEARLNSSYKRADWYFSEESAPETFTPKNWNPVFIDYLFLAFSTSTAFSATDSLPLTPKAKLLMMLQSIVSLTIIVVVGARAINILGS